MSIKFLYLTFITLFLYIFVAGGISHAADQDFFDIYTLEIDGDISGFRTGDFNDDDLIDIVLVYSPADDFENRYMALFIQQANTGFSTRADYLMALPSSVAQIDAGDVDDDGRTDIVFIDADGVSLFKFTSGGGLSGPQRLVRQKTIFSFPNFRGIISTPFLFDIIGDAALEMIIPTSRGYAIYEFGDNDEYELLNMLFAPIACYSGEKQFNDFYRAASAEISFSLASIEIVDGNLDGRKDIYFLWDRKVCCFYQDETGNFSQDPDLSLIFFPEYLKGYFRSRLFDYNNDKRPDVAILYTSGGLTNTETKIRFYIADNNGRIESGFRKELNLSDSHCNLIINDYDNDQVPELVIPAVELGSMAATKMLLMKKADLNLLIYPFQSGLPVNEPENRRAYEFRFNFEDPQPTMEVAVNWSADYNGDRFDDAVLCDGKGGVLFFWGQENEYLSKKADLKISLDHPSEIHPVHLNGGRLSDLIVEHNSGTRTDLLTVLKNRSNNL